MTEFSLARLEQIIEERTRAAAETSYTKSLLDGGVARVAKKFGEEAVETVIAAFDADRASLIGEAADVIYHLLVLLRARDASLKDVVDELERRTAMSGHAEKASRAK